MYGSQLMTEQERAEYHARMRNATSEEEREQIRLQHQVEIRRAAPEMLGIELPGTRPDDRDGARHGPRSGEWAPVEEWA